MNGEVHSGGADGATGESTRISVVIPTYNRRRSLETTLDGLRRQTLPCSLWEVVVVSDGSTDGTDTWLRDEIGRAPYRLRAVCQPNAGPSRARNRGIREAHGDVVVLLDDDVEPPPGFLDAHAGHHLPPGADPQVAVIGPMVRDPARVRREPVWVAWEHAMLARQYAAWESGAWSGAGPNHFYSGNASLRRDHLIAIGGFDESFSRQEDVELAFRIARERGVHFTYDPAAGGIHRPDRSFDSWLRTPYAYGRLDVTRARHADTLGGPPQGAGASWDAVQFAYAGRRLPTRLAARTVLALPALSLPQRTLLRGLATVAYRMRARRTAFAALSVLYNVRYLEGARDALGGPAQLFAVVRRYRPSSATHGGAREEAFS